MDDNYFAESNKFLGVNGVLGRRNFIINVLCIQLFESLFWVTPFIYLLMLNPKFMADFSITASKTAAMPMWATIWIAVMGLVSSGLLFQSIVRRVRDIIGEVDDNRVYLISSILTVIIFMGYTPVGAGFFGKWFSFFVILILIFTKGKITSQKPANNLIKFNWGAFLGTWIWGLFNRASATLWMLPLCLTFGWFPFMLICGMKGNEWARNEKFDTLEEFHKNQEKQTVVWVLLAPILVVIGFLVVPILSGIKLYNYSQVHPEFMKKMQSRSAEYRQIAVKSNFTKIELGEDEYKFYIEPEIWSKFTAERKKRIFDTAANYAVATKKNADELAQNKDFPILVATMNKTKIYSSFNNEVLAEFYITPEQYYKQLRSAKTVKDFLTIADNGYNINVHPTLP